MLRKKTIARMLAALILFCCLDFGGFRAQAAGLEKTFTFSELKKVTEWGVSSNVNSEGELEITFDGQYQSSFYEIPLEVDPSTIEKVVFNVKEGPTSDIAFKLHTQKDFDSANKEGTPVSYGNPEVKAGTPDVLYLSVMSLKEGSTRAVISSVTFYLSGEGTPREKADQSKEPLLEGANLIRNGDFSESDTSMWTADAGAATVTVGKSDTPIAGDISTYGIINNRSRSYDCISQDITGVVEKGHTYAFEFFAKLSDDYVGAPSNQRQIDFAPYITSGGDTTYLGSYSSELTGTVSAQLEPGEWTKFQGTFKVAAAGDIEKVVIRLLEQGTNYGEGDCVKGEYYVTAVSLVDLNVPTSSVQKKIPNLKDTFTKDFGDDVICGTSIVLQEINDELLMELVTKHFNAVTLGNELKPDALFGYSNSRCVLKEQATINGQTIDVPQLNFSRAEKMLDVIYDWNQEHPDDIIKVRGHVLVWHSQTPEWFFHEDYDKNKPYVSPEVMDLRLEWYIKSVLTHFTGDDSKYKGMFYGWDVVNEAVSDATGTYRSDVESGSDSLTDDTHGTKSSWWAVYQSNDFIINAFRFANMYAPSDVELYYNDYNDSMPGKIGPIVELLSAVKSAEGTRIDGMGMQAHHMIDTPTYDQIIGAARAYAAVVGSVQFTELDVRASSFYDGTDASLEEEYIRQAYRYKELYEALKTLNAEGIRVGGMTVWGVIDPNSWLQTSSAVGGGADGRQKQCPLFFDGQYQAKPSFWAIVDPSQLTPLTKKLDVFKSETGSFDGAAQYSFEADGLNVVFAPVWTDGAFRVKVTVFDSTDDGDKDTVTLFFDKYNSKTAGITPGKVTLTRKEADTVDGGYSVILQKEITGTESAVGFDIVVTDGEKTAVYSDSTMDYEKSTKYYAEAHLKQVLNIAKGTVAVIDGEEDEIWKAVEATGLGIVSGSKAEAAAKLLWDEENLYVYMTVTDSELNAANEAEHEQDSVEIFVDETNSKETAYNAGTKQYRISYENTLSFNGENCSADNIVSAVKLTDTGYIVEAAIKWTQGRPSENTLIGIELQVNDADSSGARAGTLNWYDSTNDCWENPSCFGTAALSVSAGEDIPEDIERINEDHDRKTSPIVFIVPTILVLGGAGFVVFRCLKGKK